MSYSENMRKSYSAEVVRLLAKDWSLSLSIQAPFLDSTIQTWSLDEEGSTNVFHFLSGP